MNLKILLLLLPFSILFLLSCGQEEVSNNGITLTKKVDAPHYHKYKWATKTLADGTVLSASEVKYFSDGRIESFKPIDWVWDDRPTTRPPYITTFDFEYVGDGIHVLQRKDGTTASVLIVTGIEFGYDEEQYLLLTKDNDWSVFNLEVERCDGYRELFKELKTVPKNGITKREEAAGTLVYRKVNGNTVEINVKSITSYEETETLEDLEGDMSVYEDDSSLEDWVELLIMINDDSLKISCKLEQPSTKEGKDYINLEKVTTTLKGNSFSSPSDFFEKLAELKIISENASVSGGFRLSFFMPLIKNKSKL